jgi:hypothetical protein
MRRLKLTTLILIAMAATGCGGPKLDTTSTASAKESMEKMMAGMTDEQKKEFVADCMIAAGSDFMKSAFQNAFSKDRSLMPDDTTLFKPLNGLTVAEIHAKAEETRKSLPGMLKK